MSDTQEGSGETSAAAAPPPITFGTGFGAFAAAAATGGAGFTGFGKSAAASADAEDDGDGDDGAADAEAECTAQFKPLVQLEEVTTATGEEEEEITFEAKAKSYRFDGEWKEKGVGPLKLLKHKSTHKTRLLQRREKTLKICANFLGEFPPAPRLAARPRSDTPADPPTCAVFACTPSAAGRQAVGAQRERQVGRLHVPRLQRRRRREAGEVLPALRERRECVPTYTPTEAPLSFRTPSSLTMFACSRHRGEGVLDRFRGGAGVERQAAVCRGGEGAAAAGRGAGG